MLTVPQIYAAVLEVFGAEPDKATAAVKARALTDINAALQLMAEAGEDFYGREEITVTLATGNGIYVLPKTVQSVLDPVYRAADGVPLRKLASRGQAQVYQQLFAGGTYGGISSGRPLAYFVESLRDTDNVTGAEDNVKVRLHVLPPPGASHTGNLVLNVISEAGTLTEDDLEDDTKKVPVPHKYAESILLPLVRWNATTSHFFVAKDMLDRYREDYRQAITLLGMADPARTEGRLAVSEPAQQRERRAA